MLTKLLLSAAVVLLANTCNNKSATDQAQQDTTVTAAPPAEQSQGKKANPWALIPQKRWKLLQLDGKTMPQPADIWLEFDTAQHRFSGNGGCNRLGGNYDADSLQIRFNQVISTRMACLDQAANERESAFLRLINDHTYTLDIAEQTLNLYDSGKVVLMFGMQDKPVTTEKQ
jgi:heat shock protein HslJ